MIRRVRVLRRAQRDLQEIYDFIVREAPRRADPFIDGLLGTIENLATMSERGAIPRDELLRQQGYRFLVHGPYLVFYKVLKRDVRVYRVVRGSRAYHSLL
ncbi:MAG: type II toxin-antitoxin system RelE/ParE family toxin [Deltaproteobacteria bacterium]|nr:MAG: type II toxin-antitoxin system RelE/ParE family toxin [Deltaproteobacteria bacterium]TMQ08961.1 MAG: type II toxin-antitoxin system RelE/ParE family toxin [Deltaproteobacteria bacterium]